MSPRSEVVNALLRVDVATLGDPTPVDLDGRPAEPVFVELAKTAVWDELMAARDVLADRLEFSKIVGGEG